MARDWPEARARLVTLEEDMPDTFGLYVNWIYSHRIYLKPFPTTFSGYDVIKAIESNSATPNEVQDLFRARHSLLIRADILGDKLLDRDFQDATIDAFIEFSRGYQCWPVRQTRFVYENTLEGSPLRALLVHISSFYRFTTSFKDPTMREFSLKIFSTILQRILSTIETMIGSQAHPRATISASTIITTMKAQSVTDINTAPDITE